MEPKLSYTGVVSFDAAGQGEGAMLYPAPNAGGLIAAIITHGVLVESTKSREKQRLQTEADKVIAPYEPVLREFTARELMQRGLDMEPALGGARLVEASASRDSGWWVETAPVFAMTQDQRALVLENVVVVHRPGGGPAGAYRNTVKVVAAPIEADEPTVLWMADEGKRLKDESARLFAQSIELALTEAARGATAPGTDKTFRYMEGGTRRSERGQLLAERCQRVVLKTLRGWLMSVPQKSVTDAPTGNCN